MCILYFEFILQNKSILVLGRPWLSQNTVNTLKPDNKLKSTCLFIQCKHIGQCLHFRLKLIFNSSRLPLCDDITTLSLFLPYLCLSSGGPEDYICPSAPRQAHTHTNTHSARAVRRCTYCIIFRKWLEGFEIKGFVQRENIPPSIPPQG